MRALLLALSLALIARPVAAQDLPTGQLQVPTLTLPIEVVKAAPAVLLGSVNYERAGLKPREYRISGNAQMTGATWKAFQEGPTTTKTVNGHTVISGAIRENGEIGARCDANHVRHRAFVQFRTSDISGKVYISNVKGDSACVGVPG